MMVLLEYIVLKVSPFMRKKFHVEKPLRTILGKSEIFRMTEVSGAYDKKSYDVNNILLKISEENDRHRWVYVGGDKVSSFLTDDDFYKYISIMGNNLTPFSIAIGQENIYFFTPQFKFIKRERIDKDKLLNANERSVHPYGYHVSNCEKHLFKKNEYAKFIQSIIKMILNL